MTKPDPVGPAVPPEVSAQGESGPPPPAYKVLVEGEAVSLYLVEVGLLRMTPDAAIVVAQKLLDAANELRTGSVVKNYLDLDDTDLSLEQVRRVKRRLSCNPKGATDV